MLKVLEKITDIRYFKTYKEDLILITLNNKLINRKKEKLIFNTPITGFEIFNNKIYLNDWEGEYLMYDIELNELDRGLGKGFFQSSNLFLGYRSLGKDGKMIDSLIGKKNEIIELGKLDKFNNLNISNEDKYIINCAKNQIHAYTLPDATPLWQFDLGKLGTYKNSINEVRDYEVKQFVGVYEGQLIVRISDASFLFLDINSGELLKRLNLKESNSLPSPVFYNDDDGKAHLSDGKLVWLNNQRLLHIDLMDYQIKVIKDYFEGERGEQYRFMHNTLVGDKIYFVADYGWQYVVPTSVGVMDANTGAVLWKQQLEKTGGLPEAPQVSEDKLYVRTVKGELYIFQKESV